MIVGALQRNVHIVKQCKNRHSVAAGKGVFGGG